jgi:hypothetical protein
MAIQLTQCVPAASEFQRTPDPYRWRCRRRLADEWCTGTALPEGIGDIHGLG